eukprot:scaffold4012_cov109-Isochrysis_galbana.AAC.1
MSGLGEAAPGLCQFLSPAVAPESGAPIELSSPDSALTMICKFLTVGALAVLAAHRLTFMLGSQCRLRVRCGRVVPRVRDISH